MKSTFAAALSLCMTLAFGATHANAQNQIVVPSGAFDVDGVGLGRFGEVQSDGRKRVSFATATFSVMSWDGVQYQTYTETGDPLPAPLAGTFATVFDPVVNDSGEIAFWARLNSALEDTGYFYQAAPGVGPVHINAGLGTIADQSPDIGANGDIVWMHRNFDLYHYDGLVNTLVVERGTTTAPGGAEWKSLGRYPVINANAQIAFFGDLASTDPDGIFLYDPLVGSATAIARGGDASPVAGATFDNFDDRAVIAIDDAGRIAFYSELVGGAVSEGIFLYDPASGNITTVALPGDSVGGGGATLDGVSDRYVGIDDAGAVAFLGEFPPNPSADNRIVTLQAGTLQTITPQLSTFADDFSPRLSSATAALPTAAVWEDAQFLSGGLPVLRHSINQAATFDVLTHLTLTPMGVGVLPLSPPSISRATGLIVFNGARDKLHIAKTGNPTPASVSEPGDPSPRGAGAVVEFVGRHYMGRRKLVFTVIDQGPGQAVGIVKTKGGPINLVVAGGDPAPPGIGGTFDIDNARPKAVRGNRVYLAARVNGGAANVGVFAIRGGAPRSLVLDGQATPGGGVFVDFGRDDRLPVAGKWLLDQAFANPNGEGMYLIKAANAPIVLTVVEQGDPAPGTADLFDDFGSMAMNKKRQIAFMAVTDSGLEGVWLWDSGAITPIVIDGDPIPSTTIPIVGATFLIDGYDDNPIAISRKGDIFFVSTIDGNVNENDGLFHLDPVTGGLFALGLAPGVTPSPNGGTFKSFVNDSTMTAGKRSVFVNVALGLDGAKFAIMEMPY